MGQTKVTLSPKERELVNDASWILTKNGIIRKVCMLFGELSEGYQGAINNSAVLTQQEIGSRSPKISKGEQYEGLPWVMLDYPRNFAGTDTLSIRSFFWWGNFCSITLQLSGQWQEKYAASAQSYFETDTSRCKGWYICSSADPWQHHFRNGNYQALCEWEGLSFQALPFLKLAKKISLQDWDGLDVFFEQQYMEILQMLSTR